MTTENQAARCEESPRTPVQEGICQDCRMVYGVWFTPNEVWNRVFPERTGMVCPACFMDRAERAGIECTGWELRPENFGGTMEKTAIISGECTKCSATRETRGTAPGQDDESRCAICGWPLAESAENGCIRGNCSMRPWPENLYAPERANREYGKQLRVSQPVAPPPSWISVEERLPEQNCWVLTHEKMTSGNIRVRFFAATEYGKFWKVADPEDIDVTYFVTHWQPLPKPPACAPSAPAKEQE